MNIFVKLTAYRLIENSINYLVLEKITIFSETNYQSKTREKEDGHSDRYYSRAVSHLM